MNSAVAVLAVGATAAALLVSGGAQLADREHGRAALEDLRLPAALATTAFATAWAITELIVALGLFLAPTPAARVLGVVASAMFLAFLVVVTRASHFAEPVRCHCFGRLEREPIGRATVARCWGFLGLSLVGLLGVQDGSVLRQATSLSAADSGLLQLGLLLIGAVIVLQAVNRLRDRPGHPSRAEGDREPAAGPTPLRGAYLPDLFGARHDVRRFVGSERSILIFLSEGCAACTAIAEQMSGWRTTLETHGVVLRAVTPVPASQAIAHYPRLGSWLHQDERGVLAQQLGIATLPAAVYVGRDGAPSVSDGPAEGSHAISVLVDNAVAAASAERSPSTAEGAQ